MMEAIVEGANKDRVWLRIPELHEHRILTLPRSEVGRAALAKGDVIEVIMKGDIVPTESGYYAEVEWVE